jgi:hypothetical protein
MALYNYSLGQTSPEDVEAKVYAATSAIQGFFNSPNGAEGMDRVMNFLRLVSGKTGTTFARAPYDPNIQKPDLANNPIDAQGAHAVSSLIGLRSIEAFFAYLKRNATLNRIAEMGQELF